MVALTSTDSTKGAENSIWCRRCEEPARNSGLCLQCFWDCVLWLLGAELLDVPLVERQWWNRGGGKELVHPTKVDQWLEAGPS